MVVVIVSASIFLKQLCYHRNWQPSYQPKHHTASRKKKLPCVKKSCQKNNDVSIKKQAPPHPLANVANAIWMKTASFICLYRRNNGSNNNNYHLRFQIHWWRLFWRNISKTHQLFRHRPCHTLPPRLQMQYRKYPVIRLTKLQHLQVVCWCQTTHRRQHPSYPCCDVTSILGDPRFQKIATDWDYDSNPKGPEYFSYGSGQRVFWKHSGACGCTHRWLASIQERVNQEHTCAVCTHKTTPCCSKDTVAEEGPELVKTWHPRNKLSPHQVWANSGIRVWWICQKTWNNFQAVVKLCNKKDWVSPSLFYYAARGGNHKIWSWCAARAQDILSYITDALQDVANEDDEELLRVKHRLNPVLGALRNGHYRLARRIQAWCEHECVFSCTMLERFGAVCRGGQTKMIRRMISEQKIPLPPSSHVTPFVMDARMANHYSEHKGNKEWLLIAALCRNGKLGNVKHMLNHFGTHRLQGDERSYYLHMFLVEACKSGDVQLMHHLCQLFLNPKQIGQNCFVFSLISPIVCSHQLKSLQWLHETCIHHCRTEWLPFCTLDTNLPSFFLRIVELFFPK